MAILHLMVGLPCSGKTTWAKRIEIETGAIRLTPDEWQTRLYGTDMNHPDHDRLHEEIEAIMGELADRLLVAGTDVILDFGFWSKLERDVMQAHAESMRATCILHYAEASREVLERRRLEREAAAPDDGFAFTAEVLKGWIDLFEAPDADELVSGEVLSAK